MLQAVQSSDKYQLQPLTVGAHRFKLCKAARAPPQGSSVESEDLSRGFPSCGSPGACGGEAVRTSPRWVGRRAGGTGEQEAWTFLEDGCPGLCRCGESRDVGSARVSQGWGARCPDRPLTRSGNEMAALGVTSFPRGRRLCRHLRKGISG